MYFNIFTLAIVGHHSYTLYVIFKTFIYLAELKIIAFHCKGLETFLQNHPILSSTIQIQRRRGQKCFNLKRSFSNIKLITLCQKSENLANIQWLWQEIQGCGGSDARHCILHLETVFLINHLFQNTSFLLGFPMASKGLIKYPVKESSYKNSWPAIAGHSDLMDYNSQICSCFSYREIYLHNLAHAALKSLLKQYPTINMPY